MAICFFDRENPDFYVTEFAHSLRDHTVYIKSRVREEYLLHIVINGVCHFSEFDVPSGYALLIAKGLRHHFSVDAGYEHFWIGFGGKKASEILREYSVDSDHHSMFSIKSFGYIRDFLALTLKNSIMEKNEKIVIMALRICLELLEGKEKQVSKLSDVDRAVVFMENNYHRPIKMADIAKYANISEKHLCRKFVQRFNISPQKYLINIRMEKAHELLRTTDLQIKEVSDSVGYLSQLTFSAMYKKQFGCSPSFDRVTHK